MQRNKQQHEQFLREFGALLTAHTRHGHVVQQPQALLHLADYVSSARRYRRLSRVALAQKTGKAEAEIYALEQGLLPYSELDLRFLHRLATALDEDLETLLLLLGRPVLAHTLSTPRQCRQPSSASALRTTTSQPSDNWGALHRWLNQLVKGSLNLIDFRQEGRLFAGMIRGRATYILATVAACLLFIWVSNYSLSIGFDAQSTLQAYTSFYTSLSTQQSISPVDELPVSQVVPSNVVPVASAPTGERMGRQWAPRPSQSAKAVADPIDDQQSAGLTLPTMAFLALPTTDPAAQCDLRTVGRFALCRI